jgi:type I restriction enzyme M protein
MKRKNENGKRLATQQSVDQAVKSICDIMRRGNCAGALQYVPELTWILFLRILDEKEAREEQEAEALGVVFRPSLEAPYRWRDWGAPPTETNHQDTKTQSLSLDKDLVSSCLGGELSLGWKRRELEDAPQNTFFTFVNADLLPHLRALKTKPDATPRQKVISEIMTGVERVRIDTERNFRDVLDKVHELTAEAIDPTHVFTLSQVYEGLLLKMGEKGNDGGQFFTPRQIIKVMVRVIDPQVGESLYDPGCGTGGFHAESFEYMRGRLGDDATAEQLETLTQRTFYGREKENLIYPIALANLVLHGIDKPNLWHGNTLTGQEIYGGLFEGAPDTYDVALTNPPFGGKEGKEAQTNFDYKTGATQVLFLQHVMRSLRNGGRCGIVLDEGLLFRANEDAFVKTKRKLLDDCDLWCVVSLPGGVFTAAGAGVKTNLLFFTKGQPTHKIWYYDLSDVKVGKKTPLTEQHFADFFRLLPARADSEQSWTVDIDERKRAAAAEADPLKGQATAKNQQAAQGSQRLADLKKATPRDQTAIAEAEETIKTLTREARDLTAQAKAIEDAVYDLKAVNPHRKPDVDTRTPADLMNIIDAKGKEITVALAPLRGKVNMPQ